MKKYFQLAVWVVVLQSIAAIMGGITQANLEPWYLSLQKSSLTPPGYVFGIVWSMLYTLLAIAGWRLYTLESSVRIKQLRILFMTQLVLNWLWTPVFFHLYWIGSALVCLVAIVLLTLGFLFKAWPAYRQLFWIVLPYGLWVGFATYLNFVIWMAN